MWPFKPRKPASQHKTAVLRALAQLVPGATGLESSFRLDQFASVLEKSCWLFSAVYRIANVLAATKLRVIERGSNREAKGTAADDLRTVLRKVNPDDSAFDFKQGLFVHAGLDGEFAAQKVRDSVLGRVRQLHVLIPQEFRLLPDPTGARRIGGMVWWGVGQDIQIRRDDFIYSRTYHPANHWRGMSPTAPLKRELDWDLSAARFNMALIAEGMRLGGILMPKEGYTPNPTEWEELKAELRKQNMGARNAGRFLALNAPFDFKADGIVPADMEMVEGRKLIRDMSSAVTGASPMMVMNFDGASYANAEAQVRQFWDHVGKPMLTQMCQAFTEQLVEPDFGEELELQPDYAGIDAQVDSEKTRVENTRSLLLSGMISIDEARERMGMDKLPEGGEVHVLQGANLVMKPGEWKNLVEEQKPEPVGPAPGVGGKPAAGNVPRPGMESNNRAASAVRRMNGEAEAVLARLRGDFDLWRHDVSGSADPANTKATGISGETRMAVLKAIEDLAGVRPRLDQPMVRAALRRCDLIAKQVQEASLDELDQSLKGEEILRARCLDPEARARQVMFDCAEAIVLAAEP
jgi:HK97 family phage portal protein